MRAVVFRKSLPITDPEALVDVELPRPEPAGRDLLVKVEAVSVNPVDTKRRRGGDPPEGMRVLGWDAAGTVEAAGPDATIFKPGDQVFYAGSVIRPGANSEFHLVDERIVGRKPAKLGFAEAAALPLTAITAWEVLFERMASEAGATPATLAAGRRRRRRRRLDGHPAGEERSGLTVIATASRAETQAWVRELGADLVVDHKKPLRPQIEAAGIKAVDIFLALTGTGRDAADRRGPRAGGPSRAIEGLGALATFDPGTLFIKSVGIHLELMFTRSSFGTPSMIEQHKLLDAIADLVDRGVIRTTLKEVVGPIDAANLKKAHARIESGPTIGKLVLEGWPRR